MNDNLCQQCLILNVSRCVWVTNILLEWEVFRFFFSLYSRTPSALIHFILKDNGNATLTPTVVATFVGNRQTDKRRLSVCYQNNPINYEEILMTSSGTVGQDDYILAVFRILPKIKVQGACLTADWLFHSCLVEVRAPPVLQIIIHQGLRLSNKSSKKHIFMSFICLCRSKTRDNFHQCSSKANNPHAVNKNPQWKKQCPSLSFQSCSSSVDR